MGFARGVCLNQGWPSRATAELVVREPQLPVPAEACAAAQVIPENVSMGPMCLDSHGPCCCLCRGLQGVWWAVLHACPKPMTSHETGATRIWLWSISPNQLPLALPSILDVMVARTKPLCLLKKMNFALLGKDQFFELSV